jgi:hypothetical protein
MAGRYGGNIRQRVPRSAWSFKGLESLGLDPLMPRPRKPAPPKMSQGDREAIG